MTKFIRPKTTWGKLILIVYAISVSFSIAALVTTVYELKMWSSVGETTPSAMDLFQNYGLYGGAFLQLLLILLTTAGIPLILLGIWKLVSENKDIKSLFRGVFSFFIMALIDGYAVASISRNFLDMYNDFLVLHFLANNYLLVPNLAWLHTLIVSIYTPVFLFTLLLSLTLRSVFFRRSRTFKRALQR